MDIERRKRINRIKKVIMAIIAAAILIPVVCCIILAVKVGRLEKQLADSQAMVESQAQAMSMLTVTLPEASDAAGSAYEEESVAEDEGAAALENVNPFSEDTLMEEPDGLDETDPYYIYLTFDDGPSANTEQILRILREYGVKATFFVNGHEDEDSMRLYGEIAQAGHTVGMHSYSHDYKTLYASGEAFTEDLANIRFLVEDACGVESVYYRFPGGTSNTAATGAEMSEYIEILHANGIEYIDWNVDSGDGSGRGLSADDIVNNVFKNFGRFHTNVVLLHDGSGHETTVEALPLIIERARNMGAQLLPITESTVPIQHLAE